MVAIVAVTFGFYAEMNSSIFMLEMPTVYGFRYPAVLAIVPTLHLSLLLIWQQRLTLGHLLLAVPQVMVLILAIKMRASAQWSLIVVLAIIACQLSANLVAQWKAQPVRRLAILDAAWTALRWPGVLLIGLVLLHGAYMRAILHPVYETDDVLTSHPFWHVIFINAAAFDPDVLELAATVGPISGGDELGFNMAKIWAKRNHLFENPVSYTSPLTGTTIRMGVRAGPGDLHRTIGGVSA